MPLYTYIASYRGEIYADQNRSSNFKGFAGGVLSEFPLNALSTLTPSLRSRMIHDAMRCEWSAVSNRKNLWLAVFDLDGSPFKVYAIQTDA